jgi:hypothetical protein
MQRWLTTSAARWALDGSYARHTLSALQRQPHLLRNAHRLYYHLSHCVPFSLHNEIVSSALLAAEYQPNAAL